MSEIMVPVEIAPGTYWVGKRDPHSIFHANPYLRVFRGTDAQTGRPNQFNLLIDPGSRSDFAVVSTTANLLGSGTTPGRQVYLLNLFKLPADPVPSDAFTF